MMEFFMKVFVIALILGTIIGIYVSLTAPAPPQDYIGWKEANYEIVFIEASDCSIAIQELLAQCATCMINTSIYDEERHGCWLEVLQKEW